MKKLFLLISALAVLAACSNNDDLPVPVTEQEAVVFDLNALSYEGVMTRLSETNSLKDVTFIDGDVVKKVSELKASDNIDPEQAAVLTFVAANEADSISMTVSPEYVNVCSTVGGQAMAYIAYADGTYQKQLADFYEQLAPVTRSGVPVATRTADNGALKLNLTGLYEVMKAKAEANGGSEMEVVPPALPENAVTRGWLSNLFNKIVAVFKPAPAPVVVKTPTIDIYMMKEKGANPLTHEMNWQVNDAISALKDVQSNVKFNVYIKDCDYKGTNDSDVTLSGFNSWLKKSSYRNTHGVFMLCRWGGYEWIGAGQVLGRAYLGDYNVNNDLEGCGIASTNAWNKHNVAHEIGHIFGADHVTPPWYQFVAGYDLMAYGLYPWSGSGKHKDAANRAEVKKRMTLN